MFLLVISAILFLGGGIYNIFIASYLEALAGIGLSALCAGLYWVYLNEEKEASLFLEWIKKNKENLKKGTLLYKNNQIFIHSEMTQLQACASFIFLSVKFPSRYLPKDHSAIVPVSIIFSIISFVFGWWGFPFGPIYTVQSLFYNVRGGKKQKVSDLIALLEAEENKNS